MTAAWIDTFLAKMRCPHTQESLRHASDMEKQQAGIGAENVALANQSGSHVYPLVDDILRLLPDDAIVIRAAPSS
jgi:uncharacterized protein YbaR (Trm112 family)